jgi:hypothetical protein
MYFCIKCNKTHEHSESGSIFSSGFKKEKDKLMKVGYCKASVLTKTNLDGLEEKLAT